MYLNTIQVYISNFEHQLFRSILDNCSISFPPGHCPDRTVDCRSFLYPLFQYYKKLQTWIPYNINIIIIIIIINI
jgi:hypothetical protein